MERAYARKQVIMMQAKTYRTAYLYAAWRCCSMVTLRMR
jgi:hypothetical protein